jgi:phage/plasmid primase-like uncharacterized protein
MSFVAFARDHGLLLDHPQQGRWYRVPTEDKPRRRNGAYKFMGDIGFVQNHATMGHVAVWRRDGVSERADRELLRKLFRQDAEERRRSAAEAASKARWIMGQARLAQHPYFARKGLSGHLAHTWEGMAIIPMRKNGQIVGLQMIADDGTKKFLKGQASSGASFVIGSGGLQVVCEGYATGLSAHTVLTNLKTRCTVHVCFSAHNMQQIAQRLPRGLTVADNDASGTGERIAQSIGWPYWMSDVVGEDLNDAHQRLGVFRLAMHVRAAISRK